MISLEKPRTTSVSADARNEGVIVHLAGAFFLVAGPLLIWLQNRELTAFGRRALFECMNWQAYATSVMTVSLLFFQKDVSALFMLSNVLISLNGAWACGRGREFRHRIPHRLLS